MSDRRSIEVVVSVIGWEYNETTQEPGNKVVPIRKMIVIDNDITVEDVAHKIACAITQVEEDN